MERDIFLIGSGQTRFAEWWEKSLRDLIEEAVAAAIEDSPCTVLDIDMVVVSNMLAEQTNGQAHLGALTASLLPHCPPALRVEAACASGSVALHTACALLESGRAETVLIVGAEKMTDVSMDEINTALMSAGDAEIDTPAGLTFAGIFGLIAQRYMHEYGLTREQLSEVSAVHHRNAQENPYAQFQSAVTPESVTASAPVADPLRLLDCSPISDGAAACILSTTHESDMRLAATSLSTDVLSLTERSSLTSFPASREAMTGALTEADISREDLRCLEMHDCFSIAALIHLEDLGFADPGKGISFYEEKSTSTLAVNPSGGLKACGHPVGATGVKQVIDVAKNLRETKSRWGMTHNIGGIGATASVHILEHVSV